MDVRRSARTRNPPNNYADFVTDFPIDETEEEAELPFKDMRNPITQKNVTEDEKQHLTFDFWKGLAFLDILSVSGLHPGLVLPTHSSPFARDHRPSTSHSASSICH
eukprot:TRINITY_DN14038_c0_g1::TRINITY_DN14038_c0_g1_i1::g.14467::m.14467 TRINITY_DN14038_c0_g1::TRINITY_DN14038_c0_g1_i1::g.14467  ORF type:complete len:106 (+),score=9.05 TRINITY_DN14038_c0_g1_i1:3-320(+)